MPLLTFGKLLEYRFAFRIKFELVGVLLSNFPGWLGRPMERAAGEYADTQSCCEVYPLYNSFPIIRYYRRLLFLQICAS